MDPEKQNPIGEKNAAKTSERSKALALFWSFSDEDEEGSIIINTNKSQLNLNQPRTPSINKPQHAETITPFDIESTTSFENSPSLSMFNVFVEPLNLPTPMPSPDTCPNTCKGQFCTMHVDSNNSKPLCVTNKLGRKSARNLTQIFQNITNSPPQSSSTSVNTFQALQYAPIRSPLTILDNISLSPSPNIDSCVRTPLTSPSIRDHLCCPLSSSTSKKRADPSQWKDNKRKYLTNRGQTYISKRGRSVDAKVIMPSCKCKFKCHEKINEFTRQKIFEKFWKLGSREKQWGFILRHTKKNSKNRCLNRDTPNNRKCTYKYNLPSKQDENEIAISVCKTMFLNTLSVSGRTLRTAWEKHDCSTDAEEDLRGRHSNHKKVLVEDMVKSVSDHVKSFCPVESHYLRKKTSKLYLDGSLNISRMFKLYTEWFDQEIYSSRARTERQYRDIVSKNFNLGFHLPKKDQCDQCHSFRNISNPTEEHQASYQQHQSNKSVARDKKSRDKKEAIESGEKIVAAVFDFQKVLSCPNGQVSVFYYKRKLSCLNFTIFNMGTKRAACYFWDETVAKRGANEVASCLLDYIKEQSEKGVTEFRFWSDNCAGQNRNRIVFFLYTYAAKMYNVTIKHTFLEKGHTQNEGDSVHSVIEKVSSAKTIYTPEEWKLLIRWAKADQDNPYNVKSMTQQNFFDFKSQVIDKKWKKNSRGQIVPWNRVREVLVSNLEPFKVLYKTEFSDEYSVVILQSSTRYRMSEPALQIPLTYSAPLPISEAKFKDLQSLCNSKIIPDDHVPFFLNLPHGNITNDESDED